MQEVGHRQGIIRNALKNLDGISMMDTNIGEPLFVHMRERLRYAIEEWLSTDQPMIGEQISAVGQMLSTTKANFEVQRAILSEKAFCGDWPLSRNSNLGQQIIDQTLLARTQWLANAAAIQPA